VAPDIQSLIGVVMVAGGTVAGGTVAGGAVASGTVTGTAGVGAGALVASLLCACGLFMFMLFDKKQIKRVLARKEDTGNPWTFLPWESTCRCNCNCH
jgi:hypothetical protein